MRESIQTRTVRVFACALAVSAGLAIVTADAAVYDVSHNFNLNLGANDTYRGQWAWYCDALAKSNSGGLVHPPANTGAVTFDPPPASALKSQTATSGKLAFADANSECSANANGTGYHEVWGSAAVVRPDGIRARAVSTSTLALNMGKRNAKGQIRWQPRWSVDAISGVASVGDPLSVEIFDPDDGHQLLDEMLWDIKVDIARGTALWGDGGKVSIDGGTGSGTFSIVMDSPYLTSATGSLSVSWANGLITASDDSGTWDGLLPAVGAPAAFNINLGDADGGFDIGYDFTSEFGSGDFGIQATVGASGAAEEAVPEPATIVVWSLLGGLTITVAWRRWRRASWRV